MVTVDCLTRAAFFHAESAHQPQGRPAWKITPHPKTEVSRTWPTCRGCNVVLSRSSKAAR